MVSAAKAPISSGPIPTRWSRLLLGGFFSIFFFIGAAFSYFIFIRPVARIVAARSWNAVPCDIQSSRVASSTDSDGGTTYRVDVTYRYAVDGATHTGDRYRFLRFSSSGYKGKAAIVDRLRPGTTTTCWVNPDDASDAVIERGFSPDMLFGLIPLVFVLIGGGGMYAAIVGRRTRFINAVPGLPDSRTHAAMSYGTAPRSGPTLLEPRYTRRAKFIGFTLFGIVWNSVVAFFIVQIVSNWRMGVVQWAMALFLIPFAVSGAVMVVIVVWHGMLLANPRPLLTVGSDAVALGDELKVQWAIDGRADKLTALRIFLEGREEATYRRGTDSRTDRNVFARIPVVEEIAPVQMQGSRKITVPTNTMHSFDASNNKIVWSLRVYGEIPNWPDSDDEFAFTILPHRR
jgi:hypothetical protein